MGSHNNKIVSLSSVRREKRLAPCDLMIATLLNHCATIQQAVHPLQKSLANLEKDQQPRGKACWQAQLRTLATLQEEVQSCIDLLTGDLARMPSALLIARHEILVPLFLARTEMEKVRITMTAYLPLCQSLNEKSLRLRRGIVRETRSLVSNVEEAMRLIKDVYISPED